MVNPKLMYLWICGQLPSEVFADHLEDVGRMELVVSMRSLADNWPQDSFKILAGHSYVDDCVLKWVGVHMDLFLAVRLRLEDAIATLVHGRGGEIFDYNLRLHTPYQPAGRFQFEPVDGLHWYPDNREVCPCCSHVGGRWLRGHCQEHLHCKFLLEKFLDSYDLGACDNLDAWPVDLQTIGVQCQKDIKKMLASKAGV